MRRQPVSAFSAKIRNDSAKSVRRSKKRVSTATAEPMNEDRRRSGLTSDERRTVSMPCFHQL